MLGHIHLLVITEFMLIGEMMTAGTQHVAWTNSIFRMQLFVYRLHT